MSHGLIRHGVEGTFAKHRFCREMKPAWDWHGMGNTPQIRSLSQPGLLIQLQEDRLASEGHIHPWILLSSQGPAELGEDVCQC